MDTTITGTRRRPGRLLLALAASAALAAPATGAAAASAATPSGSAAHELPSINAGWTAAAFLPKGAPSWRGQTLYLVSPGGDKHDMGRIGRTEQVEAVSTDGRYVATTKVVDEASQTVRVSLRDLERGTVRSMDLPDSLRRDQHATLCCRHASASVEPRQASGRGTSRGCSRAAGSSPSR
mgnify:CR=1 FL=1